jgi:hypothetical protein
MFEPCAGNFSICQVAFAANPKMKVISGDVCDYSLLIGYGLAGVDRGVKCSAAALERWPFLAKFASPMEIAAVAIALAEVGKFVGKEHVAHYRNILRSFAKHGERDVRAILEKVQKVRANLGDFEFRPQDCAKIPEQIEPGQWCYFDPPY